jgi:hypothetical protein
MIGKQEKSQGYAEKQDDLTEAGNSGQMKGRQIVSIRR